ncbi:cAMP-dependent protein kinase inhibitor beta isoform X1 [Lemur catta]|uniref:cAMP-dependent protein kinase inhibitor beta isoform X1 n=1 Tax=Lemur catta TaxID=9447 RepID=UPI001E26780C|nr:cAMP-dependent protein kinase inhibitor beta isoform X1 [Lemur catta]
MISCVLTHTQAKELSPGRQQGRATVALAPGSSSGAGFAPRATHRLGAELCAWGRDAATAPSAPQSLPPPGCAPAQQLRRGRIPAHRIGGSGPQKGWASPNARGPGPGSAGSSGRSWGHGILKRHSIKRNLGEGGTYKITEATH